MESNCTDILFARQPIFDGNNKLYGYELLYRNLHPDAAIFEDGNKASSELLINYCGGILNDEEAPYVKVFINLTRRLLLSDFFLPVHPSRLVVEIVEDTFIDKLLLDRIKQLRQKGFQFALDDYAFDNSFDELLPLLDYIKIDLMITDKDELKSQMQRLEHDVLVNLEQRPSFLAEKVETQAIHEFCRDIGFELFQGYFLEKPQLVYGKKISNSSEIALQIVAQLQDPEITIDALSHSISRDTNLSYQILKIINSPLCRLPRKVNSLKEAVVFLGLNQIKKWSMAMVLAGNSGSSTELFRILLTRARACEIFAENKGYENPDSFFTVGLFSAIDAVMMADKKWLIEKLDLAEDINRAILKEEGKKGEVLKYVMALEMGNWEMSQKMSDEDNIELFSAHEHAINWANQLCKMI
ncbi:EAL and HDOD domain-containing protein [Aliikangiella sp. G2MR2-5]|uniref:EAL and HDOD domain-containing protein n=1 Tax=Aliikangiella sp. G2MR2-5 TaxID=2788943 RepID=UPI0018A8BD2A|nr:HDOD domain-containing protein [Aliikangiella sp. G2MR2-5]